MQLRFSASIPGSALVGLTSTISYLVGSNNTLTSTGVATFSSSTDSVIQPFVRAPWLIDCGVDQPRGVIVACNGFSFSATGLVGGLIIPTALDPLAVSSNSVLATNATYIHGISNTPSLVSGAAENIYFPPFVATWVAQAGNNTYAGPAPRHLLLAIFATTWPSPASGFLNFTVYA